MSDNAAPTLAAAMHGYTVIDKNDRANAGLDDALRNFTVVDPRECVMCRVKIPALIYAQTDAALQLVV